jgi:hypothetical protein
MAATGAYLVVALGRELVDGTICALPDHNTQQWNNGGRDEQVRSRTSRKKSSRQFNDARRQEGALHRIPVFPQRTSMLWLCV